MAIQKNDFVELEFIGKVKDGEVFDTNIEAEAKKLGYKENVKPSIVSVGNLMVVKGFDKALEGKEIGKDYSVELEPKDAFGPRERSLIKTYPIKAFLEKNINPYPGLVLALDTTLAKVISVSGGRVILDFNNPLAGKILVYDFKIKRKVEDIKEKVESLRDFFFQQPLEYEIQDKKLIIKAPKPFEQFILIYKDKFKDMLGLELEFKESEAKKLEAKTEEKVENILSEDKK